MYNNIICSVIALGIIAMGVPQASHAQAYTGANEINVSSQISTLRSMLTSVVADLRTRIANLERCSDKGAFFMPDDAGADKAGCVTPPSKLQAYQREGSTISGLKPGKTYLVGVYGPAFGAGHIVVKECDKGAAYGRVLSETVRIGVTGRTITDSMLLPVKVPASGCVEGFTNGTTKAYYIVAFTVE